MGDNQQRLEKMSVLKRNLSLILYTFIYVDPVNITHLKITNFCIQFYVECITKTCMLT